MDPFLRPVHQRATLTNNMLKTSRSLMSKPLQNNNDQKSALLPLTQPTTQATSLDAWRPVFQSAITAFKAAEFPKAESLFTKALNLNPTNPNILDCRAATYEKLDRLKDALADGRRIIALDSASAKGYLRVGKILRLMGKSETALQLYTIARTKIPETDVNFAQLIQCSEDTKQKVWSKATQRAQDAAAPLDPVHELPPELAIKVFLLLPFAHRASCTAVSRTWYRFLLSAASLWRDLHFANPRFATDDQEYPITRAQVNSRLLNANVELWLRRVGSSFTRELVLTRMPRLADGVIRTLMQLDCRGIERLELEPVVFSAQIMIEMVASVGANLRVLSLQGSRMLDVNEVVRTIFEKCRHLRCLSLADNSDLTDDAFLPPITPSPPLEHLNLANCARITNTALSRLAPRHPTLTHLLLDDCCRVTSAGLVHLRYLPNLQRLHLTGTSLGRYRNSFEFAAVLMTITLDLTGSLTRLCHFHLRHCPHLTDRALTVVISACHASIETLDVESAAHVSDAALEHIAELRPPRLKSVNLGSCPGVTSEGVVRLVNACHSIELLDLSCLTKVTDDVLAAIGAGLPMLTELTLRGCTNVTGTGLRKVVEGKAGVDKRIRVLRLDGCHRLGRDAVEWAKKELRGARIVSGWEKERGRFVMMA